MDQSLFSIPKQIKWIWPDTFLEDKFVFVMRGLHIEMNVMNFLGDILTGSGYTAILVQFIVTSGRAEAILKGANVTRSRYIHKVIPATLHLLMNQHFKST